MTRPHIIRADTIDLQDQDAPSAKDHTRQPARPRALGEGPPAPHQADALKHVEHELSEQHGRSPRHSQDLSGKELQLLHEDGDTANDLNANDSLLRNAVSNGVAGSEDDMEGEGEGEGDESLDDDMLDKISSSPSIAEDGGYNLPLHWPDRVASLRSNHTAEKQTLSPEPPCNDLSSSPFSETPTHYPLSFTRSELDRTPSKGHHQQGEYTKDPQTLLTVDDGLESERRDGLSPLISEHPINYFRADFDDLEDSYEADFDLHDFQHLLLPADDPLLDNSFDGSQLEPTSPGSSSPASNSSWDDQVPGANDDDTKEISFVDDSRFVDSGWGGECLRETEEIDFELVYALHTFVATVEGQANATKGDTMVLLDDSNSYWWLVRVVKDSSIGYLPAEHIETPMERLARLNKHRNLDLSQTMLGDQEEDKKGVNSLNPLKKAMRRRNTKTVQFTAPSYVEPSDIEYSEEEEEGNGSLTGQEEDGAEVQKNDQGTNSNERNAADTVIKSRDGVRDVGQTGNILADQSIRSGGPNHTTTANNSRISDESFETSDDGTSGKSRNGILRNSDSFFKDDGVETRKINLTPSLLRDDSNGSVAKSAEARELKTRASLDSLEKDAPLEKIKDKQKKEKKGMLGGMFRRKDKKSKGQDKDPEDGEKTSSELPRQSPTPKESFESLDAQAAKAAPQVHRQTSKLQKSPPAKLSPKSSYARSMEATAPKAVVAELQSPTQQSPVMQHGPVIQQVQTIPQPSRSPPPISEPNGSMRLVQPEPQSTFDDAPSQIQSRPVEPLYEESMQPASPKEGRHGMFSPIKDALTKAPSEPKPEKARKAKQRMPIDDFESSGEDESTAEPFSQLESHEGHFQQIDHLAIAHEAQYGQHDSQAPSPNHTPQQSHERLSESPIEVSPPQIQHRSPGAGHRTPQQPPPLSTDDSSQEDHSISPLSNSTPELIEHPPSVAETETSPLMRGDPSTPGSTTYTERTSTNTTPTWSDASLRAYLEDDSEIRDLLVVVHDKSGVKPRRDHPVVQNLFREENRKLGEISSRLDGLLGEYLARKGGQRMGVVR